MKENYKGVIIHEKSQQGSKSPQPKPTVGKRIVEEGKSPQPKPQPTKPSKPSK